MNIIMFSTINFPLIIYPYISKILLQKGVGKAPLELSIVSYFTIFILNTVCMELQFKGLEEGTYITIKLIINNFSVFVTSIKNRLCRLWANDTNIQIFKEIIKTLFFNGMCKNYLYELFQ